MRGAPGRPFFCGGARQGAFLRVQAHRETMHRRPEQGKRDPPERQAIARGGVVERGALAPKSGATEHPRRHLTEKMFRWARHACEEAFSFGEGSLIECAT